MTNPLFRFLTVVLLLGSVLSLACEPESVAESCARQQQEYEDNGGTNPDKYQYDPSTDTCKVTVGVEG